MSFFCRLHLQGHNHLILLILRRTSNLFPNPFPIVGKGLNRSACRSYINVSSTHQRVGMFFFRLRWTLVDNMKSNTMLKHLGVCRAAGGEKPPKSGGGGSEPCERGELTQGLFIGQLPASYRPAIGQLSASYRPANETSAIKIFGIKS